MKSVVLRLENYQLHPYHIELGLTRRMTVLPGIPSCFPASWKGGLLAKIDFYNAILSIY